MGVDKRRIRKPHQIPTNRQKPRAIILPQIEALDIAARQIAKALIAAETPYSALKSQYPAASRQALGLEASI